MDPFVQFIAFVRAFDRSVGISDMRNLIWLSAVCSVVAVLRLIWDSSHLRIQRTALQLTVVLIACVVAAGELSIRPFPPSLIRFCGILADVWSGALGVA